MRNSIELQKILEKELIRKKKLWISTHECVKVFLSEYIENNIDVISKQELKFLKTIIS